MKEESPEIIHKYSIPNKNTYQSVCLNPCCKQAAFSEKRKQEKEKNSTK
jgi:hypothetical protein